MRHNPKTAWLVFIFAVIGAAAPQGQTGSGGAQFAGVWNGTWDGAGSSGGFELTLERAKDALTGKVAVSGEPSYEATLAKVAFDGNRMTAQYDFTPQPEAEVLLQATFDGNTATGTWTLRQKGTGTEVISGGWSVKKK